MRPKQQLPITREEADKLLRGAQTKGEYQRVQCIRLRLIYPDKDSSEIAVMVGMSKSWVSKIQAAYIKYPTIEFFKDKRGGRFHSNLTEEDEDALLKPFLKEAISSNILEASEIKAAYEEKVGKEVPKSTIYRMLARHGWRKIVPYKRHPKANKEEQETFKKTSQIK